HDRRPQFPQQNEQAPIGAEVLARALVEVIQLDVRALEPQLEVGDARQRDDRMAKLALRQRVYEIHEAVFQATVVETEDDVRDQRSRVGDRLHRTLTDAV